MADPIRLLAEGVPPGCHLNSGCGFPAPGSDIFDFAPVWQFDVLGITFDITKPMILLVIAAVVVVAFFVYAFRNAKIVPRGAQNVAEYGYLFVRDGIARDIIGKAGDKFVPLLFSLFFFIWVLNFLGVVPFAQFAVTSRFAIPVAFAAIVYLLWVPLGMIKQGPGAFLKTMTMPPDVPKAMYGLLIPIEFVSNFLVRPFTHSVRLFANMFAGHLLIVTFQRRGLVPVLAESDRHPRLGRLVHRRDRADGLRGADPGAAGLRLHPPRRVLHQRRGARALTGSHTT